MEAFPDLELSDEFRKGMSFAMAVADQEIARLRDLLAERDAERVMLRRVLDRIMGLAVSALRESQ